jgi:hypothetical protein
VTGELEEMRADNQRRLDLIAAETGQNVQIGGRDEFLLTEILLLLGGEDAVRASAIKWEEFVAGMVDRIEEQVRRAKLTAGVAIDVPSNIVREGRVGR